MDEDQSPDGRTALYRFFDDAENLLYVGVTSHPEARFSAHSRDKAWWDLVARTAIEWFDNRAAALGAETQAIKAESPRHNHTHGQSPLLRAFQRGPTWQLREANQRMHRHIASDIRKHILDGEVSPGDRLPTTDELKAHYRASTTAIQNALSVLKEQGFAAGRPGAAVYASLPAQVGTEDALAIGSGEGDLVLLSEGSAIAPAGLLKAMNLQEGLELGLVRWLRHHDGVPVEYVREYRADPLRPIVQRIDHVLALPPTSEVASLLELPEDASALQIRRVYYDADDIGIRAQLIFKNSFFSSVTYNYEIPREA